MRSDGDAIARNTMTQRFRGTRTALTIPALLLALGATEATAAAQPYPTKPIRLIVTGVLGGSDDFHGRVIAQKLTEVLRQQVIVDNRPGGRGLIGRMAAINASPDGYSLLFGGVSMAGDRFLNANATYDVMRDFAPVSTVVTYQFVMVVPASTPAQNVKELIAFAKSRPAKKFPSGGIGGLPYLSAALFNSKAGIDAIHVPYKSAAALYVELIDGQTDYYISPMSSALPHVHSGKVRALGVTGAKRSAMFPNVPTIAEAALPDYDVTSWMSVLAPAKTPKPIVHALNGALGQVLAASDVRERLAKVGSEPAPSTPEALARRMAEGVEWFAQVTKLAGIKPE
jgi:tripartite-type tricarboxylate transporter receptor subunit TctC